VKRGSINNFEATLHHSHGDHLLLSQH